MADKKKMNEDGELGGYAPAAPGIHEPFVIAEAGHEGARAVFEYVNMAEGRIAGPKASKFRDYDGALQVSKDV